MSRVTVNHTYLLSALLLMMICACSRPGEQKQAHTDTLRHHITTFWDTIDIDSLPDDAREQNIVDFLYLLQHSDSVTRSEAWPLLNQALDNSLDKTVVDYLGESDSPLFSADMLDEYLSTLVKTLPPTDINQVRAAYLLENIRKNRPGHPIADLQLITPADIHTSLHSTLRSLASMNSATSSTSAGNTEEVLILFYDPDCDNCDNVIDAISQSPDTGEIIAVSVTDATKPLPSEWHSFRTVEPSDLDSLFYLPSLPALYFVNPATLIVNSHN